MQQSLQSISTISHLHTRILKVAGSITPMLMCLLLLMVFPLQGAVALCLAVRDQGLDMPETMQRLEKS